jgi:beta-lactamase class D
VGENSYKKYLEEFNYGNQDILGGLTKFWLNSSLEITAEEQINFLNRMYRNELPVSQKSLETVKKIIVLEKLDNAEFSGKTATALEFSGKTGTANVKGTLGWFVGHLYSQSKEFTFATNIEAESGATSQRAKAITKELLKELRLYPVP